MRVLSLILIIFCSACTAYDYDGKIINLSKGDWSPSEGQAQEAFTKLRTAVEAKAKEQKVSLQPWENYKFQYYGVIYENHFRLVFINAFCENIPNWKSVEVTAIDGYTCFFRAFYNPEKGKFTAINFNDIGG